MGAAKTEPVPREKPHTLQGRLGREESTPISTGEQYQRASSSGVPKEPDPRRRGYRAARGRLLTPAS